MRENLQLLGYSDEKLRQLNVIHVAGTKGKGSTCAFIHSFLKEYGERTGFPRKVGLFTSPHLVSNRERIRIDMNPLSEPLFSKYFFQVWDRVYENALQNAYRMPGYLQLLMLLSVHAFAQERVDVAIYETYSGGEYCATNVSQPIVTGITTLGLDHTDVLGPLIENIAWHKGGIFKPGIAAYTNHQEPKALEVLRSRAAEKGTQLQVVGEDFRLPAKSTALEPQVQRANASLALAMTDEFLKVKAPAASGGLRSQDIDRGLNQYTWPGRFHRIIDGRCQWYIDIAHNDLSARVATQWFAKASLGAPRNGSRTLRVLVFSHDSFRDGAALVKCIAEGLSEQGIRMKHVIFTISGEGRETSSENRGQSFDDLDKYAALWRAADPHTQISFQERISAAVRSVRVWSNEAKELHAFVTGTTRLVGPVLDILEGSFKDLKQTA